MTGGWQSGDKKNGERGLKRATKGKRGEGGDEADEHR